MIGLPEVVAALAERLSLIDGLRVTDHVPMDTEYPAAFIVPPDIDYQRAFRLGAPSLSLDVVVLVAAAVDRQQRDLFDYLSWSGPKSVADTLRKPDKTLGLTGVDCTVMTSRPLGEEEMAGYRAYGAAITVLLVVTNPENP